MAIATDPFAAPARRSDAPVLPEPFWQKIALAMIGPVCTVVLGGIVAQAIVGRTEEHRKLQDMRMELIREMSDAANGLYFSLQDYARRIQQADLSADTKEDLRNSLDSRYRSAGIAAAAIETRLKLLFAKDDARKFWHAARDILQVRYFKLIGLATDPLLADNASDTKQGEWHSGLTQAQLKSLPPEDLMKEYRDRLDKAVQAVLRSDVAEY